MVEDQHVVGDPAHHGEVVADQHDGPAAGDMIAGQLRDERGRQPIQGGGGLIEQQHLGLDRQGTRQAQPLRLSAGQLGGAAGGELGGQPHPLQQCQRLLGGKVAAAHPQLVGHPVGQKHRSLCDQADPSTQPRHVHLADRSSVEQHTPRGGVL